MSAVAFAVAELPLHFWLTVFGVNSNRWFEQAAAANAPESEVEAV
ncbi:MAG TPA: hypothetical protein VGV88_13065 [Candidatus Dormibacteraeota bacterium]|nr:hypothetical protein [Candidatus Dormibacteraeota bacterium]